MFSWYLIIGISFLALGIGFVAFGHVATAVISLVFGLAWLAGTYRFRRSLKQVKVF